MEKSRVGHDGVGSMEKAAMLRLPTGSTGTIDTPQGPIRWTVDAPGHFSGDGNGQRIVYAFTELPDGSTEKAEFSWARQDPYLRLHSEVHEPDHAATLTMSAGASQLTLVADIDNAPSSGIATVSGVWVELPSATEKTGAAPARRTIHWTGQVGVTPKSFGSPASIPGWPRKGFSSEMAHAAFFAPLGLAIAGRPVLHMEDAVSALGFPFIGPLEPTSQPTYGEVWDAFVVAATTGQLVWPLSS